MNELISKELLSLVLDEEVLALDSKISNNMISRRIQYSFYSQWENINLDTLGKKCKEWCSTKGVYLLSGKTQFDRYKCFNDDFSIYNGKPIVTSHKSETEAIIKATEYVAKKEGLL